MRPRPIGFSTGALAPVDVRRALAMLEAHPKRVVELSALREHELPDVVAALEELGVGEQYEVVSLHALSGVSPEGERSVIDRLERVRQAMTPIVIDRLAKHPASSTSVYEGRTYAGGLTKFEPAARAATCRPPTSSKSSGPARAGRDRRRGRRGPQGSARAVRVFRRRLSVP